MDVDESSLYRRSRNHVKLVNLEQPGRYRHRTKIEKITIFDTAYLIWASGPEHRPAAGPWTQREPPTCPAARVLGSIIFLSFFSIDFELSPSDFDYQSSRDVELDDQMTRWPSGSICLFFIIKELNILFLVGTFYKKLWRKLVKVEGDLKTIAGFLEEYHLASQAVEIIMRTVQEMVSVAVAPRWPRGGYCAINYM